MAAGMVGSEGKAHPDQGNRIHHQIAAPEDEEQASMALPVEPAGHPHGLDLDTEASRSRVEFCSSNAGAPDSPTIMVDGNHRRTTTQPARSIKGQQPRTVTSHFLDHVSHISCRRSVAHQSANHC